MRHTHSLHLLPLMVILAAGCSTRAPVAVDARTAQLASSGRAAYDRGATLQAARFYELAMQRARARDDGPEIARSGYNLAACQLSLGRPAEARVTLREALAEFGRWRMDSQPALLLAARAAQAAGQGDEARRALDLAFAASKSDAQRVEVWLARGECAADGGDQAGAAAALQAADGLRKQDQGHALDAAHASLSGRVAMLAGNATQATSDFDAAADAWQRAGQPRPMAEALGRAGEASLQAQDAGGAVDRFYRAARSLQAQGDPVGALTLVERGLAANAQAANPELQELLSDLLGSITISIAEARAAAEGHVSPPAK
ncbi:MAG: hypothetical protein K8T26_02250 [Lentisphaerae bacterium]|nr:hypothetical protein [Lentisphaerota bacterium]